MQSINSRVLKWAHLIYADRLQNMDEQLTYDPHLEWRNSLKRAWAVHRLCNLLRAGVFMFHYMKKDGSIREAIGTLQFKHIPVEQQPKGIANRHNIVRYVAYYDLRKHEWRSFDITQVHLTCIYECHQDWTPDSLLEFNLSV
jgi:hypothetical protein